jgi:hypothetical protein
MSTVSYAAPGPERLSGLAIMVVGSLLYSVKSEPLDDALVQRRTRALIEEPIGELTAAEEREAIAEALASNAKLRDLTAIPEWIPNAPTEDQFRDFLARVLASLDAERPWPPPPHQALDVSRWTGYAGGSVVARLPMDHVMVEERLQYGFRPVEEGGARRNVLILRLRSGDEVALVSPWWPDSSDVAVLSRDPERTPEDVVAALVDGTALRPDEVQAPAADRAAAQMPPGHGGTRR